MVRKVILGTNSFQVLVDIDRVIELQQENFNEDEEDDIDDDELDLEDMLQTDTSDAFVILRIYKLIIQSQCSK